MILTIHDANLKKVAFIDNEKQNTLHYFDDVWTRNLETGSSTFEFTVLKKPTDKTYNYLNEKAFVSFKYNGKSYVFNVMTVEENEQTITCYCENLNLELINEYANTYKASKAMTFVEYCNAMDLLNFTYLSVGINEISDQKRTLEWEGQDTKLARLLSIANKFDAEIEFDTQLNADSTIKSFKVNVYHENDDTHQGVGRIRNDIQLTYGKNLKSITRKIDKTNVVNAIRPTGVKDGNTVVISGLSAWEEKKADGIVEFYQRGEMLYAPLSMQMYPSAFTSNTTNDQWTRKDITVDSDNPTVIRSAGIRELKKNAYPAITYDVDGFIDVEVGDTVKIYDDGFSPTLIVEARVADQKISFTNPDSNKTTFANFKALENRLSDGIQAALERTIEATKRYTIKPATSAGVIFKNGLGESIMTGTLYKGATPIAQDVTWVWFVNGAYRTTGPNFTVRGSEVSDKLRVTMVAHVKGIEVAREDVDFVNVLDGASGTVGPKGADGRTTILHIAYANSADGSVNFSVDNPEGREYMGQYTDFEVMDSTDYRRYTWTLVKGDKGDQGPQGLNGLQGPKGDQGLLGPKGADGKSSYTHIAYANMTQLATENSSFTLSVRSTVRYGKDANWFYKTFDAGTYTATNATFGGDPYPTVTKVAELVDGFSTSNSAETAYIGVYVDFNSADSTNPADYNWTLIKGSDGAQGIPGPKGEGGRTPYLHIAYANNSNGTAGFSTTDSTGRTYIGHYTDHAAADSTNPASYKWTLIKGDKGDQGPQGLNGLQGPKGDQGLPGSKGADGKTQYTHIAYADNESGGGFSQTDRTKYYIGMYQDFTATDSTNPSSYKWTKWKGSDGAQGIPGPKGADGQTPYIHFAYSDNADGTGLTLSDNGQRYMGYYTDYTQADSTDKTKYTWADRWAKVEVGGENLVDRTGEPFVMGWGITNTTWNPETKRTRLTFGTGVERAKYDEILPQGSIFESQNVIIKQNQTYTQAIRVATDATFLGTRNLNFSWYGPEIVSGTNGHRFYPASIRKIGVNEYLIWSTVTWDRPDIMLRPFDIFHLHTALDFRNTGTFLEFYEPKLELGTVPTAHSISENDRQRQLDSKADQAFTEQQLNLLTEKAQQMQVELDARVTMEALSAFERAYNAYVEANDKAVTKSENDLIEAGRRVDAVVETLGGLKKTKTFIDTYITEANEGIIIGTNDNVSQIRVAHDRIAMYSAGKEVMYISQGVIHIDNGVFTKSLQTGRFITSQHESNPDINICRYVG